MCSRSSEVPPPTNLSSDFAWLKRYQLSLQSSPFGSRLDSRCATISKARDRYLTGDSPLASTEKQIHLAPADQPRSVHELTERLFPAYTVEGGAVHLAGCRLEDRLFIRTGDASQSRAGSLIMDDSGSAIEEGFALSLGMDDTVPWVPPPEMPPAQLEEMVRHGTQCARKRWGVVEGLDAVFIWCKYAEGKLRFTIGEQSEDLQFSGWTRTLQAPPFSCPHSGMTSFRIAATDDGRIVAAESIRTCAETGRRVLASELVTCDATGLAVLADQTRICPVSERPVLERALATCAMCCQRVSPAVIKGGRCLACRSTQPIGKDQAPLPTLLKKYATLSHWPKWTASETAEVHILIAAGWWKRLLLVVDKNSCEVTHAAMGQRFSEFTAIKPEELNDCV